MNVIAIGTNLKTYEKEFIYRMFHSAVGCSQSDVKILDAASNKIKSSDKDVVATFGKRAKELFTSSKEKFLVHLTLPETKLLTALPENEDNRVAAYEQLLGLKNLTPTDSIQVVTEDSLPVTDIKEILSTLSKIGIKEWQGINRHGQTIRLTLEPDPSTSADINITFAELFTLKTAMETLQVKEFQIVTSSKPDKE